MGGNNKKGVDVKGMDQLITFSVIKMKFFTISYVYHKIIAICNYFTQFMIFTLSLAA